jgi:sugar-phosphatase
LNVELQCTAFLFDLDGVLVDSRAVVERTWRRWAQRHQIDAEALLREAHGRRTRDTLEAAAPHLALDSEIAWLDSAELEELDGMQAIPGARELLSRLPADRWAVVTSCSRQLAELRLRAVALPTPEVLVVSEDVQHGKPAPDGYRLGAHRLGAAASSCIVFEDAPAGVAAGRAAGAAVVGLTTSHAARDLAGATVTIPDLSQVRVRDTEEGFRVVL